jgi:hypothetical protein
MFKRKICQNCKRYWIVKNEHEKLCWQIIDGKDIGCKMKQLVDTHPSNYNRAENFDENNFKSYFPFPLELSEIMDTVFTADKYGRAFDFGLSFRENEGVNMTNKTMKKIVDVLNKPNHKPERDLNLKIVDGINIQMDGKNFITIRGWGQLISNNYSVGSYGLSEEKARQVQKDFVKFIWSRLTIQKFPENE